MSEANNLEVTASDILLFLKDNMVVKEEFNEMKTEVKTLRSAMEDGFSSIFVELSGIKERLSA